MPENKSDAYVEGLIAPLELPFAYRQFTPYKDKPVPDPPYLIYYISQETSGGADNKNFLVRRSVTIELYTDEPDPTLESKIEDALSSVKWTKYEDYIESERMYMVSYEFDYYYKIKRRLMNYA